MTLSGTTTWPCEACKGHGTRVLDGAGRAVPEYTCRDCQGYGQHTVCPLCSGSGCWDCDNGKVAGP